VLSRKIAIKRVIEGMHVPINNNKATYIVESAFILAARWRQSLGLLPKNQYSKAELGSIPPVQELLSIERIEEDPKLLSGLPGVGPKIFHLFTFTVHSVWTGVAVDRHVRRLAIPFGHGMASLSQDKLTTQLGKAYRERDYIRVNEVAAGLGQLLAKKDVAKGLVKRLMQFATSEDLEMEMRSYLHLYNHY
jgi:endonuclease III